MESNIFKFVWRYSKRQQIMLLVLTAISFPFLYFSLDLPKTIVNEAIGMLDGSAQEHIFKSIKQSMQGKGLVWVDSRVESPEDFDKIFVVDTGKVWQETERE